MRRRDSLSLTFWAELLSVIYTFFRWFSSILRTDSFTQATSTMLWHVSYCHVEIMWHVLCFRPCPPWLVGSEQSVLVSTAGWSSILFVGSDSWCETIMISVSSGKNALFKAGLILPNLFLIALETFWSMYLKHHWSFLYYAYLKK